MNLFNKKILLSSTITLLILSGCGGGEGNVISSSNSSLANYSSVNRDIAINSSNQVFTIQNASGLNRIKLNISGHRDIYAIVTSHFPLQNISISSNINSRTINLDNKSRVIDVNSSKTPINVIKFRREVNTILHQISDENITKAKPLDINRLTRETNSFNFCVNMNSSHNCNASLNASIVKVIPNILTRNGSKNLIIWLEDGNTQVSQSDIDKLANIFLKSGGDNDIYDWVTNIYGAEWANDAQEADVNLIPNSNSINILLYNMNSSQLAGYFWAKDNFKKSKIPASNEKIMFYINTQLLRVNPKETYTTLGHEFQHMIHFYQRNVLKGIEDSTWYDELMSESTEDLIATKIGYKGPRNVSPYDGSAGSYGNRGGRFPNFNRYNTDSITSWSNTTKDYSKVSAFGTYLLRNYNGATLLNKLMFSDNSDQSAIVEATGKNFKDIVRDWGSAVILSDKTNAPNRLKYNFGDFKYTQFNGITYSLGSINFFNYIPNPSYNMVKVLNNNANLYYKVGSNINGNVVVNVNIEKGGDITIISK